MRTFNLLLLSICTGALFSTGCFRQELQTADYIIPELKTEQTAQQLQKKLSSIEGVQESSFELSSQTLQVTYASSTIRSMNIEQAIAESGFSVNKRPAMIKK